MVFVDLYIRYLQTRTDFSHEKLMRIKYSAESLLSDLSKLMLYVALAAVIREWRVVLGMLIPSIILRPFMGGVHKNTYWGCFLYGLCWLLIGGAASKFININGSVFYILTMILCADGIYRGPVISSKKKAPNQLTNRKKQQVGGFLTGVLMIVGGFFRQEVIGLGIWIGLWLVFSQVICLNLLERREKRGRIFDCSR